MSPIVLLVLVFRVKVEQGARKVTGLAALVSHVTKYQHYF